MGSVINNIFQSVQSQFVDPIGNGLWLIIGPVWAVAFAIALLSLIFGFGSMQRGAKIGIVAGLALFGYVLFGFGGDVVSGITGGAVSVPDAATSDPAANAIASAEAARDAAASL